VFLVQSTQWICRSVYFPVIDVFQLYTELNSPNSALFKHRNKAKMFQFVLQFGANNCVSTKFTVASVVLRSLHGSFKVTLCFSVLRALRVFPWLCNRRMIVEFASRRLTGVNCVLRVVSCLNSFEQKHSSERKEIATLNQQSFRNATLAPASVSASSLKRPHVAILRIRRLHNLFSVSSRAKHP